MRLAASGRAAGIGLADSGVPAGRGAEAGRRLGEAELRFAIGGGRTVLSRQLVRYPLHLTRPFYLDAVRPELATVYLQSASGGLYSGDRIALTLEFMPQAAAHVTTPATTIVHDTRGFAAEQTARLRVGAGALAALTPEPLVLFAGAAMVSQTIVSLEPTARAILTDGFFHHDPAGQARPFQSWCCSTTVCDPLGHVLSVDRGRIDGMAFAGPSSPLGRYRASGTMYVLGPGADRLSAPTIEARLDQLGCLAAISPMPNNVGTAIRILAFQGGDLARGLEAAFALAFCALLGAAPARRRK